MGYLVLILVTILVDFVPSGRFSYAADAGQMTIGTGIEDDDQTMINDTISSLQAEIDDLVSTKLGNVMDLRDSLFESRNTGGTNWSDLSKKWEKQKAMQTAINTLSTVTNALTVATNNPAIGILTSFVFGFFVDSETSMLAKQMTAEFKQVNNKLDGLYTKLGSMEEIMKNFIEFDTYKSTLNDYTNVIKNAMVRMSETLDAINKLYDNYTPDTHEQDMMNLRNDFKQFYEDESVESNINNLVRLVDWTEDTYQMSDIFTIVREFAYCDILELQNLYSFIETYLLQAAQIQFVYESITVNQFDAAEVETWISTLKSSFDNSLTHCLKNAPTYAKAKVESLGSNDREAIAMELTCIRP